MKVVIFSNIPAPYFVEYLNELSKYVSVLAVFERRTASDRDKTWEKIKTDRFDYDFLDGINYGPESSFSLKIISAIKRYKNDCLIFANPMTPSGIVGIMYCIQHKIEYAIQSEGGLAKNGKGLKEKLKKFIICNAKLCLSGMSSKNDYFLAYGANSLRVKRYPFASLHEKDIRESIPTLEEKSEAKRKLGIEYKNVLIYVGRMLPVKGVDVLLHALEGIDNVGVYLIGGCETADYRYIRENLNLKTIHYIEHSSLDILKMYYVAADFLVLPSRADTWGLVINEAMSFGLPIITTKSCVAGLELIKDGKNGYLVESEDYKDLHIKIQMLLNNPQLCGQMGKNNLKKIKKYSYENMAYVINEHLSAMMEIDN